MTSDTTAAVSAPFTYEVHDPAELGLDPGKVDELVERARREVDAGLLPSCQLALARHGKLALFTTLGDAEPASRYVMFSCTKGFTAGAVWRLLRDGRVGLDTRVAEVVPEFGTNGKDVITVEMLLTHTSGFPLAPMSVEVAADPERRLAQFAKWRLNWEPGSRFEYHPTSAHWVLGEVVARIDGRPFPRVLTEDITRPLGLTRFGLGVPPAEQGDINDLVVTGELPTADEIEAAIGVRIDLAEMLGEVTDDALVGFNESAARAAGFPGAGGIATAADLALYYQGVLHDPLDLWGPERIDWASRVRCDDPDPIRGNPAHRSLGLQVAGEPPDAQMRGFGYGVSPRTFGHDGAAGQVAWVDPDSGISFGYLTNGRDQHVIREARRSIGLSSRAAATLAG